MRLLNSTTLKLHEFFGANIPPYAILSHTWDQDEVSFQEMTNSRDAPSTTQKAGYQKIKRCCELAAADGFEYTWVDTCCIDKSSSAELSEAINSMYRWYGNADVCYVYMPDVHTGDDLEHPLSLFSRSRWFKRGWTLQELIAPANLLFLNSGWTQIGTKSSLAKTIKEITGIDAYVLAGKAYALRNASVAQKMSWAARRETTREEDTAYCLMGIFDVNMPMLYGEGTRAFRRLQEEILRTVDDQTIFAWRSRDHWDVVSCGFLASSPRKFENSDRFVVKNLQHSDGPAKEAPSLNSKGLRFHVSLGSVNLENEEHRRHLMEYAATMATKVDASKHHFRNQLKLVRILSADLYLGEANKKNMFPSLRLDSTSLYFAKAWNDPLIAAVAQWSALHFFQVSQEFEKSSISLVETYPFPFVFSLRPSETPHLAPGDGIIGGAKFTRASNNASFAVILKTINDKVCADLTLMSEKETLEGVCRSYGESLVSAGETYTLVQPPRSWVSMSDHFTRMIPGETELISVSCIRRIVEGRKMYVIQVRPGE